MTAPRTQRFVALTLSVFTTLTIFSGVISLSSPDHAGLLLASTPTAEHVRG